MSSDRILLEINLVQMLLKVSSTLYFSEHVQTFWATDEPIIQQITNKTHSGQGSFQQWPLLLCMKFPAPL
jgi:hypothetical protein